MVLSSMKRLQLDLMFDIVQYSPETAEAQSQGRWLRTEEGRFEMSKSFHPDIGL
jgi:hypothetical protein